jgi:23S rRNA pseudouridine2604 synthase
VYNKIIDPNKKIEKTYEVMLEKPYTPAFLEEMESGVSILGTKTLPCQIEAIDALNFRIILTQGLNRQIRRMCFALGNYVLSLKRTKIGILELGPLELGKLRPLTKIEIDWLRNLPL